MVHLIQEKTIQHLKKAVSQLEFVKYFSDGYADQHKNRKYFHNLCENEKDFGIKESWSFFATSQGKSPCDGIGGTVKRSTAMESLWRYSGFNSHYELPFPYSRLYSVREVWFVSTCHSRQGISCVRAPLRPRKWPRFRICFRSFVFFGVDTTLQWVDFVSLAHGPRWLFLLSRHHKAISAAADQNPFVNKDLCTRKSVTRTIKEVRAKRLASAWQLKMSGSFSREPDQYSYND